MDRKFDRYDIGSLLAKAPLEDVLRRLGIETERRGTQTRGLCPFHQDTRPSLNLYAADGQSPAHYHCFSCGAHGNAIDLVKHVERLEFLPAVQWLAEQFGIKPAKGAQRQAADKRAIVEPARDFALRVFEAQHDDVQFKAWCAERAFDRDFLFRQGLRCITRGVLTDALEAKDIGERLELLDGLERLGLIKRLQKRAGKRGDTEQLKLNFRDQFQDCFHDGRIVIPIRERKGKNDDVVGFAGRYLATTPPDGVAKYLLTAHFEKSQHLFNAPAAFDAVEEALKAGQPTTLYLVEGFLDALRLQSLGQPAVALMGVSLGEGQLARLTELATTPGQGALAYSIFLDGDAAGFSGADRLARRLLDLPGVDLRWVGLPWRTQPTLGKDPDSGLNQLSTPEQAVAWLQPYDMPAEGIILVGNLGSQDATELQAQQWDRLAATPVAERALQRTAQAVKTLYARRADAATQRLQGSAWPWAEKLHALLSWDGSTAPPFTRTLYLDESYPRASLALTLAYHGARRGELPCDEPTWQTLKANEYLFNRTAIERIKATVDGKNWRQAAPYDAVHLPRKLTASADVLADPRRKVMPHAADLHVQQIVLNELLTQRHDSLSASGQAFSSYIPAVRWYASRQDVVVTGPYTELNEPRTEWDEPKTLSFGYQVDMDVLEGFKNPSDQGMFRPFGQCWRDFMACLKAQCHGIGSRVHVLRLDAKRYYDNIQRFVVRDELLAPLEAAVRLPNKLDELLGKSADEAAGNGDLERLLIELIFGYQYRDPDVAGKLRDSDAVIGIPQGPVLSAYVGTIALFPVDHAARMFMRQHAELADDGSFKRPRVGYARYVDDVVLFADSEELLKQLRETLQAKAAESAIALIHKGERVRSGSPAQVMRQINEGRGLAASEPAWEPPIMGDGESGYGLDDDLPKVDRQCALQLLRHPALMDDPARILSTVKSAMGAPDLRSNDLGLCARWLWWLVATQGPSKTPADAWDEYWNYWAAVTSLGEGVPLEWVEPFKTRGYHLLYAVEGLDKLLDPQPWQVNGEKQTERDEHRHKRVALARLVCDEGFLSGQTLSGLRRNQDHVERRAILVQRKAAMLTREDYQSRYKAAQEQRSVTPVEWLCLAGSELARPSKDDQAHPLGALKSRELAKHDEMVLANNVICILRNEEGKESDEQARRLAIDFVVESAGSVNALPMLARFSYLLQDPGVDGITRRELIRHLPNLDGQVKWLYQIDVEPSAAKARRLYRWGLRSSEEKSANPASSEFSKAQLLGRAEPEQLVFEPPTDQIGKAVVEKGPQRHWRSLSEVWEKPGQSTTRLAADLFETLLTMHRLAVGDGDKRSVHVPFRPQLFAEGPDKQFELHLVADRVPHSLLGATAWYHDLDDHVQSTIVPLDGADLWRVGWTVADVLGVAADMGGETGARDEQLDSGTSTAEDEGLSAEAQRQRNKQVLEGYVLRQQLRKLQGNYLSSGQLELGAPGSDDLPPTVRRALSLLRRFPSDSELDDQVRHVLAMEAETRAMAERLKARTGDDLRHSLHRIFPDALDRLPLWALEGLPLHVPQGEHGKLRPELALMCALYRAMYGQAPADQPAAQNKPLRAALALATVGIGLRGSVAALWGYAAERGHSRMASSLNLPATWATPEMARLNPEGDYQAIRKSLMDGDWTALCKASPWHWMLALIGLLDANFAAGLDIAALAEVYQWLCVWQTRPAKQGTATDDDNIWPFDALPEVATEECDAVMLALPQALMALDQDRGMHVVEVEHSAFGRTAHSTDFLDAKGATWAMSKPQFSNLYRDKVAERRPTVNGPVMKLWTETRRNADGDLLSVHTLDYKLGKWFASSASAEVEPVEASAGQSLPEQPVDLQKPVAHDYGNVEPNGQSQSSESAADSSMDRSVGDIDRKKSGSERSSPEESEKAEKHFRDWLGWRDGSWSARFAGNTGEYQDARGGHFRVAIFQFRVDETYAHPIHEVGLAGLPLSKTAKEEIKSCLKSEDWKSAEGAAKRGAEFKWAKEVKVISWPEHRRRALLKEALDACKRLGVQMLVLPEVSMRPDTVKWLRKQLANHEGLAVLAGTYRNFEATADIEHLKEKLTLLWRPDKNFCGAVGLDEGVAALEFKRDKKYRAVAAHELFQPGMESLGPLFSDRKLAELIRANNKAMTVEQAIALVDQLNRGDLKLRHCMELICSELFLLTSPANKVPLKQDLAKVLALFGGDPSEAKTAVDHDTEELSELLTVAQGKRERRSVLLVPACTSRSNDYWHAGQASVLASGTATVFCNTVGGHGVGGSCFIGIDSVTDAKPDPAGIVKLLTPYHGWSKGILRPDGKGALSRADQALVVVDLDPVHVVSGKPRPQLLPEPMSLVAYLPVVEVLDKAANAAALSQALNAELTEHGAQRLKSILAADAFPDACGSLHERTQLALALKGLLDAKKDGQGNDPSGALSPEKGGSDLDHFAKFFGDSGAVRERILTWLRDRHQQPAARAGGKLEPAWLDFLVADLTWDATASAPEIRVPPWRDSPVSGAAKSA